MVEDICGATCISDYTRKQLNFVKVCHEKLHIRLTPSKSAGASKAVYTTLTEVLHLQYKLPGGRHMVHNVFIHALYQEFHKIPTEGEINFVSTQRKCKALQSDRQVSQYIINDDDFILCTLRALRIKWGQYQNTNDHNTN